MTPTTITAVSSCCGKPMKVGGEGITHFLVCESCQKPCDPMHPDAKRFEDAKREFVQAVLDAISPVVNPCLDFLNKIINRFR